MTPDRHRVFATEHFRLSKTIEAPLPFVYDWLTDYRTDDATLFSAKLHQSFRVVKLSPRRTMRIRITPAPGSDPKIAVDLVRLSPPDRWHTDQIDEDDLEAVDYRLTAQGAKRTRLSIWITERWLNPRHPSHALMARQAHEVWDRYVAQIEARYRSGKPAIG